MFPLFNHFNNMIVLTILTIIYPILPLSKKYTQLINKSDKASNIKQVHICTKHYNIPSDRQACEKNYDRDLH